MHVAMCSKSHPPSCHNMISPIGAAKVDQNQDWSNPQDTTGHCKETFCVRMNICMCIYSSGSCCNRCYSECNYFHHSTTGCR